MVRNRIQARHRVLEDHRDLLTPQVAHLGLIESKQILALEDDLSAFDMPGGLGQESHDRQVRDRLAAARLATRPSVSPSSRVERDSVDGVHGPIVGPELDHQIADGEQMHGGS